MAYFGDHPVKEPLIDFADSVTLVVSTGQKRSAHRKRGIAGSLAFVQIDLALTDWISRSLGNSLATLWSTLSIPRKPYLMTIWRKDHQQTYRLFTVFSRRYTGPTQTVCTTVSACKLPGGEESAANAAVSCLGKCPKWIQRIRNCQVNLFSSRRHVGLTKRSMSSVSVISAPTDSAIFAVTSDGRVLFGMRRAVFWQLLFCRVLHSELFATESCGKCSQLVDWL